MNVDSTVARPSENATAAVLGVVLVGGVYADGWAHLNVGGLETFFTPWHGLLYGGFGLLVTWMAVMVWRRRPLVIRRVKPIPMGYGWGWMGVAVFAAGGVGDLLWHLAFGIEAGIDALVSPTHLLLSGGVLLLTSPLRAATTTPTTHRLPAVVSLASATSLAGFFLSYASVFATPGQGSRLAPSPMVCPGTGPRNFLPSRVWRATWCPPFCLSCRCCICAGAACCRLGPSPSSSAPSPSRPRS